MGANASKYRDRVVFTLEAPGAADGMGGTLPTVPVEVATRYAQVKAKKGLRSLTSDQLQFDAYYEITLRGRLDFEPTEDHRVTLPTGEKLTIHTVLPQGTTRDETVLTAVGAK